MEASIAEMEAAVEKAEKEETGEYQLPEPLQEAEKLQEAIRSSLERMKEVGREHLHPGEPEARLMPCAGRKDPAYNAQAVVDGQAGIMVAETVVNAESDNQMLVPMLEEVKANLGEVAKETVADGGYSSAAQLGEAQARGYEVLVVPGVETGGPNRGTYASGEFEYDHEGDEVICPQGKRLRFAGMKKQGPQRPAVRLYRCHAYAQCPVRALCSRRKDGRRVEVRPQRAALMWQRTKRRDPVKQALLRRRKVIVEPVFGILKQVEGFRRWTVRGLENVRTQWALVCTAYNLKKLCKVWKQRLAVGTLSLRTPIAATALALKEASILSCPSFRLEF